MNERKESETRELLAQMQRELDVASQLGKDSQRTVMLDQQAVGRLSRMDAIQQQAMAQASQRQRRHQTQRISAALKRLDEGEYGYCVSCGDQISTDRLTKDPAVPTCLECARG